MTLRITYDPFEHSAPAAWDYATLFDLPDRDHVEVLAVEPVSSYRFPRPHDE